MKPRPEIVVAGVEGFAARGAAEITTRLSAALAERATASFALAGGSTPRPVYRALAGAPGGLRPAEWRRVHFFWSDERCVPPGDPRSNVAAATGDLLEALGVPPDHVHAPRFEGDSAASAAAYEREIRRTLDSESVVTPKFDLVLLGVGPDGHTASLFPNQLSDSEAALSLVTATRSPVPPDGRISFTFELLAAARRILILAAGESKAEVVRRALEDGDRSLPVARVDPRSGSVCWLLDSEASGRLGVGHESGLGSS